MMRPRERQPWWTASLGLVAAVIASGPGRAVDDDIVVDEDPVAAARQPNLIDLGANFDANLFEQAANSWTLRSGSGGKNGPLPASPSLARARELGLRRIERIEASCTLTEPQRTRLMLALESDARRFAAEVDAVRGKYTGRQVDLNEPAGQREWNAFQQDVGKCRERLRNLFDESGLFNKVLPTILDEQQLACLTAERAARRSFHWRAIVLEAMTKIDESLGLDQRQHDVIVAELFGREPPLRTEGQPAGHFDANWRRHLVLMVLAEVDAKPIRAAVSERQWKGLSPMMNQGRAMRSAIEAQGFLEKTR
jgi:hypothetical protein